MTNLRNAARALIETDQKICDCDGRRLRPCWSCKHAFRALSTCCTSQVTGIHAEGLNGFILSNLNLCTHWCKNYTKRMYSCWVFALESRMQHNTASIKRSPLHQANKTPQSLADCACCWSPAPVHFSPIRHRETRFINIAVRELWQFSLWVAKSRRVRFQNEQWAFGNWNRLVFAIIMISVSPIDTVMQGSLNKPCVNWRFS